jgi:hypothetical protein
MALFLVILQMTNVYGAMTPLPSQLTGSATVQKAVQCCTPLFLAPISTSGNNVYITWSSNKTGGDFEIMFRASSDNGQTFGERIVLSNATDTLTANAMVGNIK